MNSDNNNIEKEKSNARQAGIFTSIGVASTTVLGIVTAKAFSDLPIDGPEDIKLLSEVAAYSPAGATAYGLYYTIQNSVDLNFKHAAESLKGFVALPLLATSMYMVSENIDFYSLSNEENNETLIIDTKPLSEDGWDRDGWDHKIVCKGLEYMFDSNEEDPSP